MHAGVIVPAGQILWGPRDTACLDHSSKLLDFWWCRLGIQVHESCESTDGDLLHGRAAIQTDEAVVH